MDQKKLERSWILYDCGNSAYSMAITTALFPVYFEMLNMGRGMDIGFFNSFASLLVAVLSPILGTIADYKDKKKRFFLFFFLVGVLFTAAFALVQTNWKLLAVFYVLTVIGFSGANIFYDAFLVDVTTNDRMDAVSTKGYAYGYIFSVIPFGISLAVIYLMGMEAKIGYQLGFLITALWWGLLTIPMLRNVRQIYYVPSESQIIKNSFKRLFTTLREARKMPVIFLFLLSYYFYIDGVDTIIKMVVPYANDVLGKNLDMMLLLVYLMVIQIVAFPFAILYGKLAARLGTLVMIRVGIATYIASVIFAYFISSIFHIFVLGFLIASAQGGIQALSRSYYAKIIPKNQSNEFFGIYNIFGKFAAIMGPLIMATITRVTDVPRYSILGIVPLFLIGFFISLKLPKDQTLSQ